MGPDSADALRGIINQDTDLITDLHAATTKARKDNDSTELIQALAQITAKLTQQAEKERKEKAKEFSMQLKAAKQQLAKTTGMNDNTTTQAARRLTTAQHIFESSIKIVNDLATKKAKTDKKIDRCNQQIGRLCEASDEDSSDTSEQDALYKIQTKRDQLTKERTYLQQQLFEHFDETLGGMSGVNKQDKRPLDLPKSFDKVTARTIIDAIKAYLGHRANEYYAILLFINYIISSYNPKDGTYYQPLDKSDNYDAVPENIRDAYSKQSELLYREILTCIKQQEMAKITTTFIHGLNKDRRARCTDDGCMAVFCLLSKYGKNDAYSLTDLEAHFTAAPHHFSFGSPAVKVAYVRPYLEQVLELGVQLKASQTIIPIMETLSDRHSRFAVALNTYANGGNTPNDCAATLEQMFSEIERTCDRIERATGGPQIWQVQTHANSARFTGKGGKGKGGSKGGKGKGAKGNQNTHRAYEIDRKGKGKGKGGSKGEKGKGNNNKQPGYGMCWAKECTMKSGPYRFCTEHFKQGMEQGHITCYNGYKQEIVRGNRDIKDAVGGKDKNSYGFSKSNLQGMAAMGQHMMQQAANMINNTLKNNGITGAQYIDPFINTERQQIEAQNTAPAKITVFKRLGEANQADTKEKNKRIKFIEELGKYES